LTIALPLWFGTLVTALVCGAALWKGGTEERLVAGALALNVILCAKLRDISWPHVQLGEFAIDVLTLAFFVAVALRTPKYWPLAAAAFQLLGVMTHVAKLIDPLLQQWAYITAGIIWTYMLFAAILTGTWNSWRARRGPQPAATRPPAAGTRR
jgi:hypothetical protein